MRASELVLLQALTVLPVACRPLHRLVRPGVRLDVDAARAEEQECEEGGLADTLKAIVRRTMPCPRFVRYHEAHVQRYLSRLKAFPPRCTPCSRACGFEGALQQSAMDAPAAVRQEEAFSGAGWPRVGVLLHCLGLYLSQPRGLLAAARRASAPAFCCAAPFDALDKLERHRRLSTACGRSTARNEKRLQALRACVRMITVHAGGCTTPFPFEAAIWLLEELEELYGGAVPICGQASARDAD